MGDFAPQLAVASLAGGIFAHHFGGRAVALVAGLTLVASGTFGRAVLPLLARPDLVQIAGLRGGLLAAAFVVALRPATVSILPVLLAVAAALTVLQELIIGISYLPLPRSEADWAVKAAWSAAYVVATLFGLLLLRSLVSSADTSPTTENAHRATTATSTFPLLFAYCYFFTRDLGGDTASYHDSVANYLQKAVLECFALGFVTWLTCRLSADLLRRRQPWHEVLLRLATPVALSLLLASAGMV